MAQRVEIVLVDDLDGGEADETVRFAVDGSSYEIDLSEHNAARLRESLRPYLAAARKGPTASRRRSAARGRD